MVVSEEEQNSSLVRVLIDVPLFRILFMQMHLCLGDFLDTFRKSRFLAESLKEIT